MTRTPFTPAEIHAAEIEAAREEGRRAGMMEAAQMASGLVPMTIPEAEYTIGWRDGVRAAANRIEAKAKEG